MAPAAWGEPAAPDRTSPQLLQKAVPSGVGWPHRGQKPLGAPWGMGGGGIAGAGGGVNACAGAAGGSSDTRVAPAAAVGGVTGCGGVGGASGRSIRMILVASGSKGGSLPVPAPATAWPAAFDAPAPAIGVPPPAPRITVAWEPASAAALAASAAGRPEPAAAPAARPAAAAPPVTAAPHRVQNRAVSERVFWQAGHSIAHLVRANPPRIYVVFEPGVTVLGPISPAREEDNGHVGPRLLVSSVNHRGVGRPTVTRQYASRRFRDK